MCINVNIQIFVCLSWCFMVINNYVYIIIIVVAIQLPYLRKHFSLKPSIQVVTKSYFHKKFRDEPLWNVSLTWWVWNILNETMHQMKSFNYVNVVRLNYGKFGKYYDRKWIKIRPLRNTFLCVHLNTWLNGSFVYNCVNISNKNNFSNHCCSSLEDYSFYLNMINIPKMIC